LPRPRLLDLFCGAGGSAVGYHRAGFDVVGVDIRPQPNYPFEFRQDDALRWVEHVGFPRISHLFDAVHASPPCQRWSQSNGAQRDRHPDLITPLRPLLEKTGLPYVIENVRQAPLLDPVVLCGSSVGLRVRRHRSFEANFSLFVPPCAHGLQRSNPHRLRAGYEPLEDAIVPVYGGGQAGFTIERCRAAMEIDWMTTDELNEAIPPAYTELIGHQLLAHIQAGATLLKERA
jgi:DNA (cytosine-5)-methyltransferase 1